MELLDLIQEYGDKQRYLTELRENEKLRSIPHNLLHLIDAINEEKYANNAYLTRKLHMTKGGICKNVKKLIQLELIESWQDPSNQQKIYYRLTDSGKEIAREHEKIHRQWQKEDESFLNSLTEEEQVYLEGFFKRYNSHLTDQVKRLEEKAEQSS